VKADHARVRATYNVVSKVACAARMLTCNCRIQTRSPPEPLCSLTLRCPRLDGPPPGPPAVAPEQRKPMVLLRDNERRLQQVGRLTPRALLLPPPL
jgi:hypothetical protein